MRALSSSLLAITLCLFASGCSGPVEQRTACAEYVSCIAARDGLRGSTTNVHRFEADGDCWGSPEGADLCETSCVNGLAFLRDREQNLPEECSP